MIDGAIFDLDGVILDSMFIWHDLGIRYLNSLGIHAEKNLSEVLFSMSMEQGAEYMKKHYALSESTEEILVGIQNMLRDFYFFEVSEKDGATELLGLLKQKGIPAIAATSSPREHVTAALKRLGLLQFFESILTTSEVGESKHSPKIYRIAAEKIGTDKSRTLVFEDSLYALKTAKQDGFICVGVYDADGESNQYGLKMAADYYIKSLSDYEAIFQN